MSLNEDKEAMIEGTEGTPEPPAEAEPPADAALLDKLAADLEEHKNLYLRTLADFQNYKRRAAQERMESQKFACQELIRDLLPVLDNLERTLQAASSGATVDSLMQGVTAIERQLRSVLDVRQVTRIESVGQPFDPDLHEALGQDVGTGQPEGTVTIEIEAGYRIGDKVIRPARVRVAGSE